jgi:hypothetical protein
MPYATAQPIVTEQINRWNVTALELLTAWNEPPRMVVALALGYDANTGVVWLREQRIEVPTEALLASWSAITAGVSIYDAVKNSLYAWLQAAGHIPADAMEELL